MLALSFAAGMTVGGALTWLASRHRDQEFRDEVDEGLGKILDIIQCEHHSSRDGRCIDCGKLI
jgi:hypothetical protein